MGVPKREDKKMLNEINGFYQYYAIINTKSGRYFSKFSNNYSKLRVISAWSAAGAKRYLHLQDARDELKKINRKAKNYTIVVISTLIEKEVKDSCNYSGQS